MNTIFGVKLFEMAKKTQQDNKEFLSSIVERMLLVILIKNIERERGYSKIYTITMIITFCLKIQKLMHYAMLVLI